MNPKVTFGEAFRLFWKNYFNFRGRSRRSEYWWMQLWHLIFFLPAIFIYLISLIVVILAVSVHVEDGGIVGILGIMCAGLYILLYGLVIIIPQLALSVRRFHDTGRTMFVPILLVALAIFTNIFQVVWEVNDPNLENGWLLLALTIFNIIVGIISIYQIVITCLNSKIEKNKYGVSPKFKKLPEHSAHEERHSN
ncbi:DUF805 domain-containing protein [Staphylococcus devriesei]|uniref:DUF805 domain-containing protein n=1 Tax=Staphylococcus devriesei TaxID=586733 RepID=A0A2K4DRW3_9STAP|nr:DUF805 domain-containing protein [Staphylococcus devriesei]MCE5090862.1 DUF805 domain-containing protein [Staphylococcus devriesei]MCE5097232.1 DUF805 domain-containing protein [Staphylococcus devriesei]PNZ89551.1 DUF805 domain-containing protein [Staphylococcus devriesei]PTE74364.1 DUF805 domain-containing protein [Staphylococcus devriesei]PTF03665.1 DUF805 domain-containing protein [Staphylococcus devriesei]